MYTDFGVRPSMEYLRDLNERNRINREWDFKYGGYLKGLIGIVLALGYVSLFYFLAIHS